MPLVSFLSGSRFTASSLNTAFDWNRTCFKATDQSVISTTTLVNVTSLVLTVESNSTYIFDSTIIYDTNAAADIKVQFTLPSGTFIRVACWLSNTALGATDATVFHNAQDTGLWTAGGFAAGTFMSMLPTGTIITGATAGSMQFQFAQNTSTAVNTTIKAGSWINLRKVA